MSTYEILCSLTDASRVLQNEPMSAHTTMRVGGPARFFVRAASAAEVAACIRFAKEQGISYAIVGNGSNLLVSDEGYDGLIICIGKDMSQITVEGDTITAEAGASLAAIAWVAKEHGLTGFEFAGGIPGTIGGACMMNAGAYGGEMKDVLCTATALTEKGELRTYSVNEMELAYRSSAFERNQEIVVSATIKLAKGDASEISACMEELAAKRREKQPLEFPSAGSTFKRPMGYFAGALIEGAGLKGKGVGDACVSEKHAGFVINRGNATAKDVYETICLVQETVKAHSGVCLEPEVKMLGNF